MQGDPFDHAYMNGVFSHHVGKLLYGFQQHPGEGIELQRLQCSLLAAILDELKEQRVERLSHLLSTMTPTMVIKPA